MSGGGIEDLQKAKRDHHHQGHKERRPKALHLFSTPSQKEGEIYDRRKKIFRKIDDHVVAEKLPGKVLEQQPYEKKIKPTAPIVQHGYDKDRHHKPQAHVSKARHISSNDERGGFVCTK